MKKSFCLAVEQDIFIYSGMRLKQIRLTVNI